MKIVHLDCKNCGAPMEVRVGRLRRQDRLQCEFCGSQALIPEPEKPTGRIRDPELRDLDRRWRRERRRFERRDKNGRLSMPSRSMGTFLMCLGLGLILLAIILGSGRGGRAESVIPFAIGGFVTAGGGLAERIRAGAYERARARYRRRRKELLGRRGSKAAGGSGSRRSKRRGRRRS